MPAPVIAALPTAPNRREPANFPERSDAFFAALVTLVSEINAFGNWLENPGSGGDANFVNNTPKIFPSRAEAVSFGQSNLIPAFSRIFTIDGTALVMRGPGATTDQLFSTYPNWGVLQRWDVASAASLGAAPTLINVGGTADAITADLPAGAGFPNISAPSMFKFIPTATNTIAGPTITVGGLTRQLKNTDGTNLPVNGLKVGRLHLFQTTTGSAAQLVAAPVGAHQINDIDVVRAWYDARAARERVTGIVQLTGIGGTPDAITASFSPDAATTNVAIPLVVRLTPVATNTVAGPMLSINGIGRRLHDTNGALLPVGALDPSRAFVFEVTSANDMRLMAYPVASTEIQRDLSGSLTEITNRAAYQAKLIHESVGYVLQSAATLPPRPPRRVVIWETWSDPTALMQDPDVWLTVPTPATPSAPPTEMWDLAPTRVSGQLAIRKNYVPNSVPPVTGIRYRVNSGAWTVVTAARGYDIITGLTNGTSYSVEIQIQNYMGWSPSATKTATPVVAASVTDAFDRADGVLLSTVPEWDTRVGPNLLHSSNGVRNNTFGSGSNGYGGVPIAGLAVHRGYFSNAQYAEVVLAGPSTNITFGPGILLQADTQLERGSQGYWLQVKPGQCRIHKNIDGAWNYITSISWTGTLTAPLNIRAEYNGAGMITLRDLNAAGALLGTWLDNTGTPLPVFGRPGIQSTFASAGEASGRIDNFVAGNI